MALCFIPVHLKYTLQRTGYWGAVRVVPDDDVGTDLLVRGSLAAPVLFGEVVLDEGGTLKWGGNKYVVEQGVLTFANPFKIDPVLDVVATARVREYDLVLTLTGPLERPEVSFSSDPPLPDLEVMSLMATGETDTLDFTSSSADRAADFQATSLLYGQASSLISQRTSKLFGFDRFRLDPLVSGTGELSSARVTVGKQLSAELFATYSYDPSTTEQNILQLEWDITRGVTLVLTQSGDESYSVDFRMQKSF